MILITSGTGFVGSYLVPRLAKSEKKIKCLVRSFAKAEALWDYGVELAQLDLDNTTDLDSVERHFGFKPMALNQGLGYIKPS